MTAARKTHERFATLSNRAKGAPVGDAGRPSASQRKRARAVTGCLAAAMAVLLAVTVLGSGPARADDFADLRAQNEMLAKRVDEMARDLRELKELLAANQDLVQGLTEAAEVSRVTPAEGAAEVPPDKTVTSGSDKVKLAISGQINRMVLFADDGKESRFFHADNTHSSSRVRFVGSAKLDDDITAGTTIEVQFESNASDTVAIDQDSAVIDNNSFTERKLELYFTSKRFGKLSLGQGDTASNQSSEQDLSGTKVIGDSDLDDLGKDIVFRNADGTFSSATVGAAFNNFDGLSRDDRIRYDTPRVAGLMVSASHVDGDAWDVALNYQRQIEGAKFAAAIAYADPSAINERTQVSGSASVLLPWGTSISFAAGTLDFNTAGRDDASFFYVKLGQRIELFKFGATDVSIDVYSGDDQGANGDQSTGFSLAAVQKVDRIGTEFYGVVRNFELDRPGASLDDVFVAGVGARVKF